jgi:peptidoglycan/xylan/chitin deacetylase (PgdA/CDA1 family)
MRGGTPVLMYHEVLAPGASPARPGAGYARYCITDSDLAAHLDAIRANGGRGAGIGASLASRDPANVVITFDDGCATDLLVAAPLLAERGFGATSYITTDWIGTAGFLDERQVRELSDAGIEIGTHGTDHTYLADLSPERIREQLASSRDRLEQITARPVRHMSCPGGRWSATVAEIAAETGYESVTDSTPVLFTENAGRMRIGRFAILAGTEPDVIADLVRDGRWRASPTKTLALRAAKSLLGNRLYDRLRGLLLERPEA